MGWGDAWAGLSQQAMGFAIDSLRSKEQQKYQSERDEIAVGCNVENASYGLTQCAERSALASSRVSGHAQTVAIAVAGEGNRSCFPCGACRQVIYERNPRMLVVVAGKDCPEIFGIDELLPFAFDMQRKENDDGPL